MNTIVMNVIQIDATAAMGSDHRPRWKGPFLNCL